MLKWSVAKVLRRIQEDHLVLQDLEVDHQPRFFCLRDYGGLDRSAVYNALLLLEWTTYWNGQ